MNTSWPAGIVKKRCTNTMQYNTSLDMKKHVNPNQVLWFNMAWNHTPGFLQVSGISRSSWFPRRRRDVLEECSQLASEMLGPSTSDEFMQVWFLMISSLPQHDFKLLQLPLAFGIIVRPRMRGSTISATPAAQSNSFRALLQEAPTRYLFTLLLFGICLDLQNVHHYQNGSFLK